MDDTRILLTNNMKETGKKRNYGLDIMRCLAMIMVVILHYLGKGKVLTPLDTAAPLSARDITAWLLEAFCIVAVNLYMLMSGYLLYKGTFKLSRLLKLVGMIWLYSVIVGSIGIALGTPVETVDTYFKLRLLLPVSMNTYWFMKAYVLFYCLVPVLGAAACRMDKKKLQIVICVLLFFHCVIKSVLPVQLENDAIGMDAMWYIVIFMVAVYIRRFVVIKSKTVFLVLYLVFSVLILGESLVIRNIFLSSGRLSHIMGISYNYNHLLTLASSVMLFIFFLNVKVPEAAGKIFAILGKYSLGVYLLHENLSIRYYWQPLLWCNKTTGVIRVILYALIAGIIVFIAGVIINFVSSCLCGKVLNILKKAPVFNKISAAVERADAAFANPDGEA